MRKSLKEYITALGHWGWVVAVILVSDIYGIISSYLSSHNANFVLPIWAWWLILVIILAISPLIAFHRIRLSRDDYKSKYEAELDKTPNIVVEPELYGNLARLRVHNKGGAATFKAKAGIIRDGVRHPLYDVRWESCPNGSSCIIHRNGIEFIKIGEICSTNCISHDPAYPICRSGIMLWTNQNSIGGSIPETVEKYKQKERYTTMFKEGDIPKDNCVVEVIITSEPSPLKDYEVRYYSIEIDHEHDNNLIFTELPAQEIGKDATD